jgi:hypothetical protein
MNADVFAAAFAALFVGHSFGDHWFGQTHHQALGKQAPGREGRRLCVRHVLLLTAHKVTALWVMQLVTGLRVGWLFFSAALVLDAVSHYVIDRHLPAIAEALGKGGFYRFGVKTAAPAGTGAYALDQSAHHLFLFAAALIIAGGAQ